MIDETRLKKLCKLTRIEIKDDEVEKYLKLLNGYLNEIECLDDIKVDENLEPLNNVTEIPLREYLDVVNDGNKNNELMKCAPQEFRGFYVAPKVIGGEE